MNLIEQIKVNDTSIDGYQGTYYHLNSEYVQVTTDSDGKILEGIKLDGSKHISGNLIVDGSIYTDSLDVDRIVEDILERVDEILEPAEDTLSYFESIDDQDWLEVTTDKDGKIVTGITKNGEFYINKIYDLYSFLKENNHEIEEYLSEYNKSSWWEKDTELHSRINQISRRVNDKTQEQHQSAYRNHPPILSLLWFTDLHDDTHRLKRILDFSDTYPSYFNDILCTGDANDHFEIDFSYWKTMGAGKVLLSLGNHEQAYYDINHEVKRDTPQIDLYNKYFKDFVLYQGVVYQDGKVYWYKDYTESKIRLINVYPFLGNSSQSDYNEQVEWFGNVLDDARTNNLSIIATQHFSFANATRVNCNFSALDGIVAGAGSVLIPFMQAIKNFTDNGGEFICWLVGHSHVDCISYVEGFEDLYFLTSNCALLSQESSDCSRIEGEQSEDCFNIIGFDTYAKLVKWVRVGANHDYVLRNRNSIVFNYKTKNIISES